MLQQPRSAQSLPIALAVFAALLVAGLFGPWLIVPWQRYSGLQGGGLIALAPVVLVFVAAVVRLRQHGERLWPARCMTFGFLGAFLWGGVVCAVLIAEIRSQADFGFSLVSIGWGLVVYVLSALVGCILAVVQWARDGGATRSAAPGVFASHPVPQVVINNAGGPSANHWYGQGAAPSTARIGVLDQGRPLPELGVNAGMALVVGRGGDTDIRITDPRSSRRHLSVHFDGGTWVVTDLGATNPAIVFAGGGQVPLVHGQPMRLASGQLAIGESVITLYPPGR